MSKEEHTRREFLQTAGLGAAALAAGPGFAGRGDGATSEARRPNILYITTDYQAGEDVPWAGSPRAPGSPFLQMPHLQRLGEEGVVFDRHNCTAPICIPSRYTMVTGQYPHTHGKWDNYGGWVPEGSPVLMEELGEAGYHNAGIGKMHFDPWDRMAGFDRRIIADNKGNWKYSNNLKDDYAAFLAEHNLTRWSYLQKQPEGEIFGVYDWPYEPELHIDAYVGDQTVQYVEQEAPSDEPWFIWSSFNGPHNPWDPPAEYTAPYKRMDLPGARSRPGELHDKPLDHTRTRYNYTRSVVDQIDRADAPKRQAELIERIRVGHYGGLSFIDHQIGRILGALEQQGQLEDTVVIFSSDHGCELGDHHNIHKGLHYQRSVRVPFVVWNPKRYEPRRVKSFSGLIDLFPTLLSMAGTDAPDAVAGRDLTPLLEGASEEEAGQDFAISEIRHGTAITTEQWKMSVYPRDGEGALYDLEEDPEELYNHYGEDAYSSVQERLEERLVAFRPALAEGIEQVGPITVAAAAGPGAEETHRLEQGTHLPPAEAPYQRGQAITVAAEIAPGNGSSENGWPDGPIIETKAGGGHGYAVYVEGGKLGLGLRRWGEQEWIVMSPERLPEGTVAVQAQLSRGGRMRLWIDGEVVSVGKAVGVAAAPPEEEEQGASSSAASAEAENENRHVHAPGETTGPLPEQPGRRAITAGHVRVGRSAERGQPVGGYDSDATFDGTIQQLELTLA
jgi:arylsulfatase A-like enzyme